MIQGNGCEETCAGVVMGRSDSGKTVFLHFEDFGAHTGRFEVFASVADAAAFLQEIGVRLDPPRRGASIGLSAAPRPAPLHA
jgi:hypothetical protein